MHRAATVTPAKPRRSPAKPRRARRPSLGHEEFLERAFDIFCEKGFDGTSIDAITAAAGIAKRTVYARYGDKENLFRVAIEQAIDAWNLPIEKLREAESDNIEDSLFAIGQLLVENILKPAGLRLLRLTNAESGRMPEIGEHNVRYGQQPIIAYLADLFRRQLPSGGDPFAEAEDAAEAFLHLVVGGPANAAAWGVVRDKGAIERRTRLSITIFLHGVLFVAGNRPATIELEAIRQDIGQLKTLLADAADRADRVTAGLERVAGIEPA